MFTLNKQLCSWQNLLKLMYIVCVFVYIKYPTMILITEEEKFFLLSTEFSPDFSLGYCCCDSIIFPYFIIAAVQLINALVVFFSFFKKINSYKIFFVSLSFIVTLFYSFFCKNFINLCFSKIISIEIKLGMIAILIGILCLAIISILIFLDNKNDTNRN
jgi:hypothetical protein